MFRFVRRGFALPLLAMFVLGFVLANALGGLAAAALGMLFFLPLLLFKIFLMLMLFKLVMGFFFGYSFGRRGPWHRRPRREPQIDEDQAEFNEFVQRARQRLDDLFPQD